jgi:hypothetical protein
MPVHTLSCDFRGNRREAIFDDAAARLRLNLFFSDKQLLHQLVPFGVFVFRFFEIVFFVDVGFFEFLVQRSDVFAGRPKATLLDQRIYRT